MRGWLGIVACAALGCTSANPAYVGSGHGFDGGGAPLPGDLAAPGGGGGGGAGDMAPAGAGDMTAPACSAGQRRCVQLPTPTSQVCAAGGYHHDRTCPFGTANMTGAVCDNGYCRPPTTNGTTSCGSGGPLESVCEQGGNSGPGSSKAFSCQPFVADPQTKDVAWWCAVAANAGAGVAGTKCTKDSDCHTGFCGSNGTCFWACQSGADCLGMLLRCVPVTITVEGVTVATKSCTP